MHPQLMLLLELQDLRSQHRELSQGTGVHIEADTFNIDLRQAAHELQSKIVEIEEQLAPSIRVRYEKIGTSLDRVVVPVLNGVCYGCFVSIATARAGERDPNEALNACEHCGRFIYILP
jgi:predicted  nucleic acid-binding Zn-ribbon protein